MLEMELMALSLPKCVILISLSISSTPMERVIICGSAKSMQIEWSIQHIIALELKLIPIISFGARIKYD